MSFIETNQVFGSLFSTIFIVFSTFFYDCVVSQLVQNSDSLWVIKEELLTKVTGTILNQSSASLLSDQSPSNQLFPSAIPKNEEIPMIMENRVTDVSDAYDVATAAASDNGSLGKLKATAHNDGELNDTQHELLTSMLHQLLGFFLALNT